MENNKDNIEFVESKKQKQSGEKRMTPKVIRLAEPAKHKIKKKVQKKLSFDAFFKIYMTKNAKVKEHHKIPMKNFMKKFGNTEAQTFDWFMTLAHKYL